MLYDTHCHPYLFKEKSQDSVLENFFSVPNRKINSIAVDIPSIKQSLEYNKKYPELYVSIGIHPNHCLDYKDNISAAIDELEVLYKDNTDAINAIWECGLDYYWLDSLSETYTLSKEEIIDIQKQFFRKHISLAKKLQLPLVIHNRNATEDIFEILQEDNFKNFVFHCFVENLDFAEKLLIFAPEAKLGFWWVTTFKNAPEVREVVKNIPLKNIIVETDAPYLTPVPYRGKEENEPLFVQNVLDTIIDVRPESSEEIIQTIYKNSTKFFWT